MNKASLKFHLVQVKFNEQVSTEYGSYVKETIYRNTGFLNCCRSFYAFKNNSRIIREKATKNRSSHQRCSIKKAGLKIFAIFTGKHPCMRRIQ